MRAITVCVDYHDYLAITLPYNIGHFEEVWVVTAPSDPATIELCDRFQRDFLPVKVVVTNLFYKDGALFNKWLALEHALDKMDRHGWLCLMDADVLWPRTIPHWRLDQGCLYTPMRRMCNDLNSRTVLPDERGWVQFPLHPQQREWAGYTQVFHADDPVLGPAPWHQTNWKHAGGADSFFQEKWPQSKKLRPPFEVLHLGPSGQNWCGRATPYLDGSQPVNSAVKQATLRGMIAQRGRGPDRFKAEKL